MSFAHTYFKRFRVQPASISAPVRSDIGIIIIIPCHNEPDVRTSIDSIKSCSLPPCHVEVIVHINHAIDAPESIKNNNQQTLQQLLDYKHIYDSNTITLHTIYSELPKKHAGVGLARKIAMDEAIHRFNYNDNKHGIIASFDADSTVSKNYLVELYEHFSHNKNIGIAHIYFEHDLQGNFSHAQYYAIAEYELYLRWYVEMLKAINFPYPYHTVGSSFAVRAIAYCRQGGMNKRQAGEDFYFLQKMYEAEEMAEIVQATVFPSSRTSDRVPFGTGFAMRTLLDTKSPYKAYDIKSFKVLDSFFQSALSLYSANETMCMEVYNSLHCSLQEFIPSQEFIKKISECISNSRSKEQFKKRFFLWFNAFMVFRYLNDSHLSHFIKPPITDVAAQTAHIDSKDAIHILLHYRKIQKSPD